MSVERTRAGWIIIGAIMTLGSSVVKGLFQFSICNIKECNNLPNSSSQSCGNILILLKYRSITSYDIALA